MQRVHTQPSASRMGALTRRTFCSSPAVGLRVNPASPTNHSGLAGTLSPNHSPHLHRHAQLQQQARQVARPDRRAI
eukprot:365742-Chlamydomonas_euryale.AAC.19